MGQLLLFQSSADCSPHLGRFKPGDIVRQSWAWVGMYDRIFPYWQIRFVKTNADQMLDTIRSQHPKWSEDRIEAERIIRLRTLTNPERPNYYCAAVPYGGHPTEVDWFHEKDLLPTGLHWSKIPTHDEINDWCRRKYATNEFVAGLNRTYRSGDGDWTTDKSLGAYAEEAELMKMLQSLPVKWNEVTRENFEVLFPDPPGSPSIAAAPVFLTPVGGPAPRGSDVRKDDA